MAIHLCSVHEIDDPGSKGFEIEFNGEPLELFVVHKDGCFYAWRNQCPHTGVNLEFQQDAFLDLDNAFIICSNHGALFECDSGLCIAGPCAGESLTPLAIRIDRDAILLDVD